MRSKGIKRTKVNIVTLGCSKNQVDSEVLLKQLRGNFIDASHESNLHDANIAIINTCGFIDNAKQESIDTILEYVAAKEEGLLEKVYVTGCLSQRYKQDLEKEIPLVDAWFGTRELSRLLKQLGANYKHELVGERIVTNPSHYAYMKISEGCDRPCSFCAIPLMRGRHISKPIEDLIHEAKNLASNGSKEILLIGQDTTYYGLDLYGKRNLASLLRSLSDVEEIEWIRLHYLFPTGMPLDILEVVSERNNICNYIDIPIQHCSTKMLKIMRRGITKEKTIELLKTIREKVPNIALRTTLIVGHPGETDKCFQELMDFVEEQRFDRLGVFKYSHEKDTHAYSMEDSIPESIKQQRMEALMELQQRISFELNQQKVGGTYKVLVDRKDGDYHVGRTEFDSPDIDNEVIIVNSQNINVGEFVQVKILSASEFDLVGEVLR